jgi:small redox-active disulfide protein 2
MGRSKRAARYVFKQKIGRISMEIKILGTGCAKCKTLEEVTRKVVADNNIDATITKVEDIVEIMKFNIMTTPALVVNGSVVSKGRIPSVDEIIQFLTR